MNLSPKEVSFISDFAAFCRTKGGEEYSFGSVCNCALAQFLRASGRCENPRVSGYGRWSDKGSSESFQAPFDFRGSTEEERVLHTLLGRERTFSALADRLEALIADAPEQVQS